MPSIKFGNKMIPYTLKNSQRRKTLSISVDQNGVSVISPSEANQDAVESTLHKKAPWIIKQLADFEEMNTAAKKRSFQSGEKLVYLGRNYRLKVIKTDCTKPSFRFYQGRFTAEIPNGTPEDQYRDLIYPIYVEWIKTKAYGFASDRIKRFSMKLQKEPKKLIVKDQEQRWGSCTPAGTILLNWRIFLAPVSMIDYVLAHELTHLKHMNHSKEFWDTLAMLLPDYEHRKEWLRMNGATLNI